jgi:hypothetical protein
VASSASGKDGLKPATSSNIAAAHSPTTLPSLASSSTRRLQPLPSTLVSLTSLSLTPEFSRTSTKSATAQSSPRNATQHSTGWQPDCASRRFSSEPELSVYKLSTAYRSSASNSNSPTNSPRVAPTKRTTAASTSSTTTKPTTTTTSNKSRLTSSYALSLSLSDCLDTPAM